uniref:Endosome-associated-trafficking regulator 1 n=1 Tax=Gopherus evgoodei TaxID=1825980 RepID=A0A8C4WKD9_9SAUR
MSGEPRPRPSPSARRPGREPRPGAANPFSFREFVRSQGRSLAVPPASPRSHPRPLSPQAAGAPGLSLRRQEPFFPDPSAGDTLLELEQEQEDAEWSGCYQPAAVEHAHLAGPGSASPGPSALDSLYCDRTGWSGLEDSAPWQLDESDPLGYAEQSLASGRRAGEGPQPSLREVLFFLQLQEENARLRSKINQLHFFSETQTDRVKKLEKKIEENKIKEQKEARDLEAMVQHVEQNLQLMTKRAVKAENNVIKLKQENALLQVQLKNYKTENEALKTGQSASLAAVKQNADTALQNLLRVITNSRSSIKQLVSGAESLQVVAELLKSIDRISEISDDGP